MVRSVGLRLWIDEFVLIPLFGASGGVPRLGSIRGGEKGRLMLAV